MNFNEFNERNLKLRPAMHRMRGDLTERDRRWGTNDRDPYDEGLERSWEQRMPPDDEYDERKDTLLKVGIKVRTRVRWSHLVHPPSLMIYVDALPENEQPEVWVPERGTTDRFRRRHSRWTSEATTNPAIHRHITICNANDIQHFEHWQYKLYHIYAKFDDKVLWLYPNHITSGSTLELDPVRDPIASDPVVQELHSRSTKSNPINADETAPGYNDPSNWVDVVAPLHISM